MEPMTLLVLSEPTARVLTLLEELPDDTFIVTSDRLEAFTEAAPEADVILNRNQGPELVEEVLKMAPRVRWMHSLSAGVNNSLCPELLRRPIPLTNGRGVFSRSLGEFAIAAMLFFAKDFRRLIRQQAGGVWEPFDVEEIHGKTMGIIGYGSLGRAVAPLAKMLGMRVIATRRRPDDNGDPHVDRVLPAEATEELMRESDYVVVTLPHTPENAHFIGADALGAMKPSAVLISMGRGTVIDEAALIEALEAKRIRGAALDVFEVEPLPDGHPFYRMENVLLSPHCADHVPGWEHNAVRFFLQNFERFRKGEPLENLVDKELGY